MPAPDLNEQLDWTEENLSLVISDIYAKAMTDKASYDELMAKPYDVLVARIKVPDDYKTRIFAREKKPTLILTVPAFPESQPSGTAEIPSADYQIICTILPPW